MLSSLFIPLFIYLFDLSTTFAHGFLFLIPTFLFYFQSSSLYLFIYFYDLFYLFYFQTIPSLVSIYYHFYFSILFSLVIPLFIFKIYLFVLFFNPSPYFFLFFYF